MDHYILDSEQGHRRAVELVNSHPRSYWWRLATSEFRILIRASSLREAAEKARASGYWDDIYDSIENFDHEDPYRSSCLGETLPEVVPFSFRPPNRSTGEKA